ncbi:hypothetical protein [Alkalisalibacterium limincola]|uniref:Uncharacterized protein n=1 Tax=Alkalisalibacterium limincola TaxID=2699169 RepID=A0A5C8KKV3_9GAMM|nr:hypothetical protein [Alkalisalibacterium limincola]TXK59749.1 hypothetical protein FU658_13315 [Alkalisalibacterium limincola]
MAQLDFFAVDRDFYEVMNFVFSETDLIVYEAYSRFDMEIRRFTSVTELEAAAEDRRAGGFLLRAWSPAVTSTPIFETFKLKPEVGSHRTTVGGPGLVQFQQGHVERGHLHFSTFSHWNEAGALQRGLPGAEEVNWKAMRKLSGRIHRHLRNKLAVASIRSASVLEHAYAVLGPDLSIWYGKEYKQGSEGLVERPDSSSKPKPLRGSG